MDKKTIDVSIQTDKLNTILEKKQNLETNIEACEKRIDEKLSSLITEGFIPEKSPINNKELSEKILAVQPIISDTTQEDIFSNIDLSDDNALDEAVLHSRPVSRISVPNKNIQCSLSPPIQLTEDDYVPTVSNILGRQNQFDKTDFSLDDVSFKPLLTKEFSKIPSETIQSEETKPEVDKSSTISELKQAPFSIPVENQPLKDTFFDKPDKKSKKSEKSGTRTPKTNSQPVRQPALQDIILPSFLFILGLIACGVYLIGFSQNFSFIDYSILFILLTCLIFTIALPYNASIFFMVLITVGYGLFIILSTIYIKIPLAAYQFGWFLLIPLILNGSALLVRRIREVFLFKTTLENRISSYDKMENTPGLTTEKAYYKDLKIAMQRASNNEIVLLMEMITIPHLDTLKSINGSRIWDEILFKTLKIIKKHCYSTHLIYVLEGNVFSIIMENTAIKNQLLINQNIRSDFESLIGSYDTIDEMVDLKVVAVPYSREIDNPFDYRSLGFKQLNH